MADTERESNERLSAAADQFRQSEAWRGGTYDNMKVTTDAEGNPVLLARRHDDHTKWDEVAQ